MLTDAVADGLIVVNHARQPRRARHGNSRRNQVLPDARRPEPKFYEPHEARAIITATPEPYRDMVLADLTTGARRGELLAMRWEWIDFAARRIWLGGQLQERELVPCKNHSEREVVLYSGLAAMFGARRQAEGYVFRAPDGRPWGNRGPEREFLGDVLRGLGLKREDRMWHPLRHTFASVLAAGGIRRDVVEKLMGHAGKGTTSIYTHLFRDAFEGVEEALDAGFGGKERARECTVTAEHDGSARTAA
jgi:integrase